MEVAERKELDDRTTAGESGFRAWRAPPTAPARAEGSPLGSTSLGAHRARSVRNSPRRSKCRPETRRQNRRAGVQSGQLVVESGQNAHLTAFGVFLGPYFFWRSIMIAIHSAETRRIISSKDAGVAAGRDPPAGPFRGIGRRCVIFAQPTSLPAGIVAIEAQGRAL